MSNKERYRPLYFNRDRVSFYTHINMSIPHVLRSSAASEQHPNRRRITHLESQLREERRPVVGGRPMHFAPKRGVELLPPLEEEPLPPQLEF